jgi:protein-S-isoprenylcysteine O-methyltransferase Ste14
MFDDPLIRRLIKQTVIWLTVLGAILFLVAGTFDWPGAWVLLIESGVLGVLSGVRIARHDPELLQERMRGPIQKDQKPWDKRLLTIIFSLCFLMPIVAGLEVRFGTSAVPVSLQVLGALALAFGIYVFHVVMETNSYASAVVRIQSERGQKVISTGPYAYVRHPMYGGAIAYFLGLGLLLGSWYAVGIGIVIIALFGVRAVWEEETLARELDGYAAYAQRVRYRLIPGVW